MLEQLPRHIFDEMKHFFEVYKALEHKHTTVSEVLGRREALSIVKDCIDMYDKKYVK